MSTPKILILAPPEDEPRLRELYAQQLSQRWSIDIAWIGGPSRAEAIDPMASAVSAHAILVVERAISADPENRYAKELAQILTKISSTARARCIACSLGPHVDPNRVIRVGPHRRSLGDLTTADAQDTLAALIERKFGAEARSARIDAGALMLSDRPAELDRVGFTPAVETLASFLAAPSLQPPLVVSVEGGWGVGKSSFLLQLRQALRTRYGGKPTRPDRDPPAIRTVWVNTWSSDGESAAYSSFALALIDELGRVGPLRAALYRVRLAWLRFDWRSGWKDVMRMLGGLILLLIAAAVAVWGLPARVEVALATGLHWANAGVLAITAVLGVQGVRQLRSFFGSPFAVDLGRHIRAPEYEAARSLGERNFEDIARILDAYSGKAERIFVLVDDLDRSDPGKVAEVTQTINVILANAGKRMIYILAIDREKVAAAIAARSKDIASIVATAIGSGAQPIDFGHLFLEKLIQVPFRVPTIASDLLATWIDATPAGDPGVPRPLQQTVELVAPFLRENPRRIKQFVNLLHLRVRLLQGQIGADAALPSLLQLGKLTVAEMLHPAFIHDMAAAPHMLQTLLLGAGEGFGTATYSRWSSHTDLLDLLAAAPSASTHLDKILAERLASLLDVNLSPILRLVARASTGARDGVEGFGQPPGAPAPVEDPQEALLRYSAEYVRVRQTMPYSAARTTKLDRLFRDMASVRGVTQEQASAMFARGEPGLRVAALAVAEGVLGGWAGPMLVEVLERPRSPFEEFHGLRVAALVWARLPEADRRVLARLVSRRLVRREKQSSDPPVWQFTKRLGELCAGLPLVNEITVEIPGRGVLRLALAELSSFDALTDAVYWTIEDIVRPYHYGRDWRLIHHSEPLRHRRDLEKLGHGAYVADDRPLGDLGIRDGSTLIVAWEQTAPAADA